MPCFLDRFECDGLTWQLAFPIMQINYTRQHFYMETDILHLSSACTKCQMETTLRLSDNRLFQPASKISFGHHQRRFFYEPCFGEAITIKLAIIFLYFRHDNNYRQDAQFYHFGNNETLTGCFCR